MIQAGFIQAFYPHTLSFQLQLFFSSLHFFLILQVIILKPFLFIRQKFRGFKVYFEMEFDLLKQICVLECLKDYYCCFPYVLLSMSYHLVQNNCQLTKMNPSLLFLQAFNCVIS